MAVSLRTRQEFRRKCQPTTLLVRLVLFLAIPSCYFLFNGFKATKSNVNKLPDSDVLYDLQHSVPLLSDDFSAVINGRHLLQIDVHNRNCTPAAILDFPSDGFTREQRKSGFIVIHCIIASYCFILLAIVCDDYFVPAIAKICHRLQMAEDIAGATFMAVASSSSELFINCIGTFITEGDLGVGTIVGSAVFNILAVPACCGLLAGQVVDLDWWAVSRDSLMYGAAVISLIFTLQDDKVQWWEALILVSAYTLYILAMYFNEAISKGCKSGCCGHKNRKPYTEITPLIPSDKRGPFSDSNKVSFIENGKSKNEITEVLEENDLECSTEIWKWPQKDVSNGCKVFWFMCWPIHFILWMTIPDCRKYKKLFPLTFIMCIVWIACTSYMVAWLITCIGDTIQIPDSVMGLTFLAAGTSVPEAVSSIIVTNQGHGSMGISNSIGSNTFDILLCLGLPWFIKALFYPTTPGENWVNINSGGLSYSAISLLSSLLGLYIAFVCNKFRLDWKIGLTCTLMYLAFLAFASLIEMNMFFPVNLPTCAH